MLLGAYQSDAAEASVRPGVRNLASKKPKSVMGSREMDKSPASRFSTPLFPFALVPAAGKSRRMGRPKLLLEFGGRSVAARLLAALARAGVGNRLVVVDPEDDALKRLVEDCGGNVLVPPTAPPEMRESVAFGLHEVMSELDRRKEAVDLASPWLLIPGDHPVVLSGTVETLLDASRRNPGRIVVPIFKGRRGHPTVFTWRHALEVDRIPNSEGFNWIL